jgi:hypothetical protein
MNPPSSVLRPPRERSATPFLYGTQKRDDSVNSEQRVRDGTGSLLKPSTRPKPVIFLVSHERAYAGAQLSNPCFRSTCGYTSYSIEVGFKKYPGFTRRVSARRPMPMRGILPFLDSGVHDTGHGPRESIFHGSISHPCSLVSAKRSPSPSVHQARILGFLNDG